MADDDFGDFEVMSLDTCPPAQPFSDSSRSTDDSARVDCSLVPCVTTTDKICACSKSPLTEGQDCDLCTCSQSLVNSTVPVCPSSLNEHLDTNGEGRERSLSLTQKDDSFDDFQQAGECGTSCQEASLPTVHEGSDDDGFADFECANAGGEFADFSAAVAPKSDGCDGEWATFAADEGVDTQPEDTNTETLLCSAFPPVTKECSSADIDVRLLEEHEAHRRLWKDLQDLDQAASLRHQWETSVSCQYLLRSLNIDSRNILRSPSVPLFAMHLGMLEPQRGHTVSVSTHTDCPSSPLDQESIPPAQFDWRSSGLENPLEPLSSSSLLDLEFLSSLTPATSAPARTSSLEEEFLRDAPEAVNSPKLPPQIEQLLTCKAPNIISRPSELSAEASRLLDRLPDLSFMRATVLMFPLHLESSC